MGFPDANKGGIESVKWKELVLQHVVKHCNETGARTFSLKEFNAAKLGLFEQMWPGNRNVAAQVRKQLQNLRKENLLTFLDNSGHYTLRAVELLKPEIEETKTIDLSKEAPEKREYIVETYVRHVKWAKLALERYGAFCLVEKCRNTFFRDDGTRYIEVHHIVPLCQGGEDGWWNLCVLCAHHHRMAHFANARTRKTFEIKLKAEIQSRRPEAAAFLNDMTEGETG